MGDDQRRAATHQAVHGVLDQGLGLAVEAGGGLVQDQDRRIGRKARASATRWRSPPESLTPRSPTSVA